MGCDGSLVLGRVAGDADSVRLPIQALVLDDEHLAESAAQLERADEAVVHQRADIPVLPRVHGQRRVEEPFLLLAGNPPIPNRFRLGVQPDAEAVER